MVADVAKPDVLLIADGSEVSTLADAAQLLAEEGISARIISVPSEGLFRDQGTAYVREILTPGVPRYGLTSGLSVNLRTCGDDGSYTVSTISDTPHRTRYSTRSSATTAPA